MLLLLELLLGAAVDSIVVAGDAILGFVVGEIFARCHLWCFCCPCCLLLTVGAAHVVTLILGGCVATAVVAGFVAFMSVRLREWFFFEGCCSWC